MKKLMLTCALLFPLGSCQSVADLTPVAETVSAVEMDYAELADNFRMIILNSNLPAEQKAAILAAIEVNARGAAEKLKKVQEALRAAGEVGSNYVSILNQILDAWVASEAARGK